MNIRGDLLCGLGFFEDLEMYSPSARVYHHLPSHHLNIKEKANNFITNLYYKYLSC